MVLRSPIFPEPDFKISSWFSMKNLADSKKNDFISWFTATFEEDIHRLNEFKGLSISQNDSTC
jgi:hypothetical protein